MSFAQVFKSAPDADGLKGCYRNDALTSLMQHGCNELLAAQSRAEKIEGQVQPTCARELAELAGKGVKPATALADQFCTKELFDGAYTKAVERCDSVELQKLVVEMNFRAARVNASAQTLGIDLDRLSLSVFGNPAYEHFVRELGGFEQVAQEFAMKVGFDMARHQLPALVKESIDAISPETNRIVGSLRAASRNLEMASVKPD
jgi:hypothetical protein